VAVLYRLTLWRESPMLEQYGYVLVFLLAGIFFILMAFITGWVFSPNGLLGLRNKYKKEIFEDTYECGVETYGTSWFRFNVSFYLYALLFVIFDIETVFLYPWAVSFKQLGIFGFGEMVVFIAILLIGLAYAWKKEALKWE
jgi:NADH:ubiquinone oxidoreductase subunit 3 (subunit A)